MEDRLLTYEEWHHKVTAGWNDGERWYQGGHSFALYLRERFGADVMARFALEYAKGWRPLFETVVEDVTGVDCRTLYDDWIAYITERYDDQYADVQAVGEVAGLELLASRPEWEYKTPSERDAWMGDKEGLFGEDARHWFGRKSQREREQAKERTGCINTIHVHLTMGTGLVLLIVVQSSQEDEPSRESDANWSQR